jgi:hypothetical protein
MAQHPDSFRDFGILPENVGPPANHVRAYFSRGRIIGQYIGTVLGSTVGLALATLLLVMMPLPLNLLGGAAALAGFGAIVFLITHNDYRWVELDGWTLRAKHLYTGRVIERALDEIDSLGTMVWVGGDVGDVAAALLGRIKGVEVRFRDRRTPLRIMRADPAMTNAKELIEALLYKMAQIREIEAEIVNLEGKPLVRNIHWKGETPAAPPGKLVKVLLAAGIFFALMFGPILGFIGVQERRLRVLGSVPPQEITLKELIEKGPGNNPHVVLTDFRFGGYTYSQTKNGSWKNVYIALFPLHPDGQPKEGNEIKAVFMLKSLGSDVQVRQFIPHGRVVGLCSDAPRLTFGSIREELIRVNPGSHQTSSWIIEELQGLPSASTVEWLMQSCAGCYVLVLVFALVIFLKG